MSSNIRDSENSRAMSRVFVAALNTPRDINQAHEFIRDHAGDGRPTVAIIDECDELIMGRGRSSIKVNKEGTFLPELSDSEESSESDSYSSDEDEHFERVAKSEMLFRLLIQPSSLLILVTATHLATYAKQISFFDLSKPATFLRARKSEEYVGVLQMTVPEGLRYGHILVSNYSGYLLVCMYAHYFHTNPTQFFVMRTTLILVYLRDHSKGV